MDDNCLLRCGERFNARLSNPNSAENGRMNDNRRLMARCHRPTVEGLQHHVQHALVFLHKGGNLQLLQHNETHGYPNAKISNTKEKVAALIRLNASLHILRTTPCCVRSCQ